MPVASPLNSCVFEDVATCIGVAAARALCEHLGGTSLYVPVAFGANHPVVAAIGKAKAQELATEFRSMTLQLPKAFLRRQRVLQLYDRGGMTVREIALATDFTERHVLRILADERDSGDERQLELFA